MNNPTNDQNENALPKWLRNPTFRPIDVLLGEWRRILGRGLLLGLSAAVIVFLLVKPRYGAQAVLNIEPNVPRILYETDPSKYLHSYEDWLRTQTDIMGSYPVLDRALDEFHKAGFVWHDEAEESRMAAIGRLKAIINILHKRETQIIEVNMESSVPDGIASLVNAVVDSYYQFMREREQSVDRFKHEFLVQERERTERELQNAYRSLEGVSQRAGVVVSDDAGIASHMQVVSELKQTVNDIMVERVSLQNNLNSLIEEKRQIRDMDLSEFGPVEASKDALQINRTMNLDQKSQQLENRLRELGERHPERRLIEGELHEIESDQNRLSDDTIARLVEIKRQSLLGENRLKQMSTQTGLRSRLRTEQSLRQRLRSEERRLLGYNQAVLAAHTLRSEITRLEDRIAEISRRIDEVSLELVVPGRIEVISRAQAADEPVRDRRIVYAAFLGMVAFSMAALSVLVRSFLDRRIRQMDDVAAIAGFPATASVASTPHRDPRGYRQLALYLEQDRSKHGSRVFAFAPVSHSDSNRHFDLEGLVQGMQQMGTARRKRGHLCLTPLETPGESNALSIESSPDVALQQAMRRAGCVHLSLPGLRNNADAQNWALQSDVTVLLVEAGRTTSSELEEALEQTARLGIKAVSILYLEG